MLGHDGPPAWLWKENLLSSEPLAECPVRLTLRRRDTALGRELERCMQMYPSYERGALYAAGGMSDQPGRYLDIMTMIGAVHVTIEEKYLEIKKQEKPSEG